jgi:hypothetical protein
MIELSGKAASKGVAVSQQGINVYNLLTEQSGIDKLQQDKVKILTHPNPAAMALPDTKVQDFGGQIEARIKAYKSLLETYQAFTLISDSRFGDKTKEALSALQESYNSIEKLPDLPASVADKLPDVAKMISQSIQAKKIKKHNLVLFKLSQLYLDLWNADLKQWNDYVDMIYNSYATGLNTIDSKRFDLEKIRSQSQEPFSDEAIVVLLYRLQYRQQIANQRDTVKKQLTDFGQALAELNRVHAEIAKTKTDITDVTNMLNTIESLLKP